MEPPSPRQSQPRASAKSAKRKSERFAVVSCRENSARWCLKSIVFVLASSWQVRTTEPIRHRCSTPALACSLAPPAFDARHWPFTLPLVASGSVPGERCGVLCARFDVCSVVRLGVGRVKRPVVELPPSPGGPQLGAPRARVLPLFGVLGGIGGNCAAARFIFMNPRCAQRMSLRFVISGLGLCERRSGAAGSLGRCVIGLGLIRGAWPWPD